MRSVINICLGLLVVFVQIGCRTKKVVAEAVAATSEETDSVHVSAIKQEGRTEVTLYDDWGRIEFADSGGTLTIDTGGRLKAEGVKSYHQGRWASVSKTELVAQEADSTVTRGLRGSTVCVKPSPQREGVRALKWYQRMIYYIGALCCVMVIIYAVLLYLRCKR